MQKNKKAKKVLIFSLTYYPFMCGAEVAIKEITDRIDTKDIQFDMVTLRFDKNLPDIEKVGNVMLYRIGFTTGNPSMADLSRPLHKFNKLLFPFFSAVKASQLHKKYHYDGIWAMMAAFAGFGALFFKMTHMSVPYVLTLQEGDPIDYIKQRVRFIYPLFVRIFTSADFIQSISTYLANWRREMGFKGPLEVIPNAVNVRHFSQTYSEQELYEIKQQMRKGANDIFLITTSRLVKKNAVDDVIKSLLHLPKNMKFLVLGIGPDEEKLRKLARDIGVERRVIFLGHVNHNSIPKYLRISDIFIRPSLSEGMGNSFIEAMAASIPVIGTQEGGIADFLFDPDLNPEEKPTGRAVFPRSPKDIALQVEKCLRDKEITAKIVHNARELVFSKYDWDLIATDMKVKVFDKLLSKVD